MQQRAESSTERQKIELSLKTDDLKILDKYRGDLTPDAFFSTVLRMIDGGAISEPPPWVKKKLKD